MTNAPTSRRGQVLILATLAVVVIVIFIVALQTNVTNTGRTSSLLSLQRAARNLAEAGIDHARWKLNTDVNYPGETFTFGDGEIVVAVTTVNPGTRSIEATGYYPTQANPRSQKTVRTQVTIDAATVAFNYGVQVDRGGVAMSNNAGIIGNIYANGSIIGAPNTFITGDAYVATGITADVSHEQQSNPPDGDYLFGQTNPNIDVGMSFRPNQTGPVSQLALKIKKNSSSNPNVTIRILGDSGGSPDKNAVLASGTLNASLVSQATYDWITVAMTPTQNVTANGTYWIVFDATQHATRYWFWAKDKNEGYGNGVAKYTQNWNAASPVWNVPAPTENGDMNFRVFIGGSVTKIDDVDVTGNAHANTIEDATIASGDAYYQTISNTTVRGSACPNPYCHPGSPDPPLQNLPVSDANIADWEADATAGGVTACSGTRTITGVVTIGPQTYTCDVLFDASSIVTVAGTVWIQGNMNFGNNAILRLDAGYGSNSGIIIADNPSNPSGSGTVTVSNNVQILGSGTQGSYMMVLSTRSGATPAIDISNNTTGAIFYASRGIINVANNVNLKEATGYRLVLANNATVTYESGLASSIFTSGPGGSWQVTPGTWQEL